MVHTMWDETMCTSNRKYCRKLNVMKEKFGGSTQAKKDT